MAMRAMLDLNGLEKCIVTGDAGEVDTDKQKKAKGRILLSIDESLYVHVENSRNAAEMWDKLENLFQNTGAMHKIGLIQKLINIRLENCESMSEYVSQISGAANKLNNIGLNIRDELVSAIMLAGLTEEFKPLTMGFEGSGIKTASDAVKTKLIDTAYQKESHCVFLGKNASKDKRSKNSDVRTPKCNKCGKKGHKSNQCRYTKDPKPNKNEKLADSDDRSIKASKDKKESRNAFSAMSLSKATQNRSNWYIDSGASQHMTSHEDWLSELRSTSVKEIVTANNKKMAVSGTGKVVLRVNDEDVGVKDVLYVPELTTNILSVNQMVKNGNTVVFDADGCSIK